MKKRNVLVVAVFFIGLTMWNCTDKTNSNLGSNNSTLQESLSSGTTALNQAVTAITQSKGYQLLTMQDQGAPKLAATMPSISDSILLDSIKGIYEYQKLSSNQWCRDCFHKLFKKTGDTTDLVIKLPEQLALHPWRIKDVLTDTTLTNNFVIDVPEYRYVYSMGLVTDYRLTANAAINDTSLGSFHIQSSRSSQGGVMYSSSYNFTNGYQLALSIQTGDTLKNSFSLTKGDSVLIKETSTSYRSDTSKYRQTAYQLTIGNVGIQRMMGSDSITVSLGGVVQQNAKVKFIDTNSTSDGQHSVCHHTRDIQITFNDGTTTTLSSLIGPSIDTLRSLQGYLGNVVFATNLVNYVAWGIHTNTIN